MWFCLRLQGLCDLVNCVLTFVITFVGVIVSNVLTFVNTFFNADLGIISGSYKNDSTKGVKKSN